MYKVGDSVRVVKIDKLPGMEGKPELTMGAEYTVLNICEDSKGNQHLDIGLRTTKKYVRSFETEEELPLNKYYNLDGDNLHKITQWCHPTRFELI